MQVNMLICSALSPLTQKACYWIPNILAGHTHIVLYVRGGSQDSRVAIQVKKYDDSFSADAPFDVKAGEWKLVEIPISQLGNVSGGIKEFYIKNFGSNPNTIYVDDIGLR